MRKRLICILMCVLMIISAMTTILYSNNVKVEASGGGSSGGTGLDYNFMWNVTQNLSNIVYTSYPGNVIRKGRMFGTDGDRDAADYIYDKIMTEKLNLENVNKITLGPIKDYLHKLWYVVS